MTNHDSESQDVNRTDHPHMTIEHVGGCNSGCEGDDHLLLSDDDTLANLKRMRDEGPPPFRPSVRYVSRTRGLSPRSQPTHTHNADCAVFNLESCDCDWSGPKEDTAEHVPEDYS